MPDTPRFACLCGDRTRRFDSGALLAEPALEEAVVDSSHSRFPAGSVGVALFLLRLADGFGLASEGLHLFTPAAMTAETTGAVLLGVALVTTAIMLLLGLRTMLAGAGAAVFTVASAPYMAQQRNLPGGDADVWYVLLTLVLVLSSALALTGPGAYSLDARHSGWRRIKLPSGKSHRPNLWETFS
jgi:uncharacterized membrane protein YphA (DoxX/SURF4 family)